MSTIPSELLWLGDFVELGPASFRMGAAEDDRFATASERPVREISIGHRFAMGVFPVTVAQWRFEKEGSYPVVDFSWNDIDGWLKEAADKSGLPLRLPSEAEWEFAARAGRSGGFPMGDSIGPTEANFLHDDGKQRIGLGGRTPRGCYPPNGFGLEDMLGNVAEWVADTWSPDLSALPADGRPHLAADAGLRVVRSAGWDALPRLLRLSARHPLPADRRQDNLGFRLACDLP
ncbi:formylglycine-generating enzyme family protein [Luteolibacter marinus]|uniref:formylglycine-generating enzyme family protein n=1 Tax=Luteolibacter marinus TaxID=2776705 RepID=UPI001868F708|nr:SUMF1/EgtB/PvdO family nonheme iron enzyme [Luteolibacter marinus]